MVRLLGTLRTVTDTFAGESLVIRGKRIGYCRTSTRDQNLDHQLSLLAQAGCDPIFPEQLSGRTRKRPKLQEALDMIGRGDTLVVTRLSRLSRSVRDLIDITDELRAKGADFIVTQQDIDTTTAAGRFMFTILAAVAEFEREMIAENTRDGLAEARANGKRLGRAPALDPVQAARLREMHGAGASIAEIRRHFNIAEATVYNYLNKRS